MLLGPLAVQIAQDLQLTAAQKGLMVATPVLSGALLRMVMGILVDHLKPKMTGLIGQLIVIAALLAPGLAAAYGWGNVFGLAAIPLIIALVSFGVREAWMALALFVCAMLALVALTGLTAVKSRWRTTWGAAHLSVAKV